MSYKVYVANFTNTTTEADLRSAFEPFGAVSDIFIATDRDTALPRGFAFVTYDSPDQGKAAIEKMNNAEFAGRVIAVSEARAKEAPAAPKPRNFAPDRRGGASQGGRPPRR